MVCTNRKRKPKPKWFLCLVHNAHGRPRFHHACSTWQRQCPPQKFCMCSWRWQCNEESVYQKEVSLCHWESLPESYSQQKKKKANKKTQMISLCAIGKWNNDIISKNSASCHHNEVCHNSLWGFAHTGTTRRTLRQTSMLLNESRWSPLQRASKLQLRNLRRKKNHTKGMLKKLQQIHKIYHDLSYRKAKPGPYIIYAFQLCKPQVSLTEATDL